MYIFIGKIKYYNHLKNKILFVFRAKYDIYSKKLQPPPENWPKYCICELPWCPNLAYIQCDACLKWFHLECVNINENIITEIENYVCSKCQKSIQ